MEKGLYDFQIDPELESFMPALSEEAEAELESSLRANGCYNPIHVWNGFIIDGHNRYRICKKYSIPFAVVEHDFADKYEAMRWMLQEQNCRRNMSIVERVEVALKYSDALKAKGKETQGRRTDLLSAAAKSSEPFDTRMEIAKLAGPDVSRTMVQQIERIFKDSDEDTKEDLRKGRLKVGTVYKRMFGKNADPNKEEVHLTDGVNATQSGDDTPVPPTLNEDITDAEVLGNEVYDLCNEFADKMRDLKKKMLHVEMAHKDFYEIQSSLRVAAESLADNFSWFNDISFSDEREDSEYEEFGVVDEMVKTVNSLYKEMLEDALWNLNQEHLAEGDVASVVDAVNDTHRDALKIIHKNVHQVGQDSDEPYTKASALKDMLRACTDADEGTIAKAVDMLMPMEGRSDSAAAASLEKPIPFVPAVADDTEDGPDIVDYKILTPIPAACSQNINDANTLVKEVQDLCDVFDDDLGFLKRKMFQIRITHDDFYEIQESLRIVAKALSRNFSWFKDVTFSDEEPSDSDYEVFAVVDEMVNTADSAYRTMIESALWQFNRDHVNDEDISSVITRINDTHLDVLKEVYKAVYEAAGEEDNTYTKREALRDVIKAGTDADEETVEKAVRILTQEEDQTAGAADDPFTAGSSLPVLFPDPDKNTEREPASFSFVYDHTGFVMRNMLGDIKLGLSWLKADDEDKKPELIRILNAGEAKAKANIEAATGIPTDEPEECPFKPVSTIKEPTEDPVTKRVKLEKHPYSYEFVKDQILYAMSSMLNDLQVGLDSLRADNEGRKGELIDVVDDGFAQARNNVEEAEGC